MKKWVLSAALLLLSNRFVSSQTESFKHIKLHRHYSASNRAFVDKSGVLTFNDANRIITFEKTREDRFDDPEKVDISYDAVKKIVFEVTTHMRGGVAADVISAASIPGVMAGAALRGQHVHDHWFYIEYEVGGETKQNLFKVGKGESPGVIDKASKLFDTKVTIADFHEVSEQMDIEKLKEYKTKQSLKIDKTDRPMPEVKSDKATIVVVCPPLVARYTGKGNQFKLHANDNIVAVNKAGTYSIAYLDPGRYRLVSQTENASGFDMELEAGKIYYFLQSTYQGVFKWETALSHNSPEVVTYLMSGTYYSKWAMK